jgi:hypothetical protein
MAGTRLAISDAALLREDNPSACDMFSAEKKTLHVKAYIKRPRAQARATPAQGSRDCSFHIQFVLLQRLLRIAALGS